MHVTSTIEYGFHGASQESAERISDPIDQVPTASRAAKAVFDPDDEITSLLRAVHHRCDASFKRFHCLTYRHLLGTVSRIVRSRDDAEELLQDIYLKIWNRCAQFNARKGCAISWLTSVARNAAIDHVRQRQSRPRIDHTMSDLEGETWAELPSNQLQPLETVIRARDAEAVQRCLSTLSTAQRESLLLAYYGDMSHREIAHRLGRPIGTVKTQLRRSLSAMRPVLDGHR